MGPALIAGLLDTAADLQASRHRHGCISAAFLTIVCFDSACTYTKCLLSLRISLISEVCIYIHNPPIFPNCQRLSMTFYQP